MATRHAPKKATAPMEGIDDRHDNTNVNASAIAAAAADAAAATASTSVTFSVALDENAVTSLTNAVKHTLPRSTSPSSLNWSEKKESSSHGYKTPTAVLDTLTDSFSDYAKSNSRQDQRNKDGVPFTDKALLAQSSLGAFSNVKTQRVAAKAERRLRFKPGVKVYRNQKPKRDQNQDKGKTYISNSWIKTYIELQKYRAKNGHVNVFSEGPHKNEKLAKWVSKQKEDYWKWRKALNETEWDSGSEESVDRAQVGTDETIKERAQLLENIGMEWDYRPTQSSCIKNINAENSVNDEGMKSTNCANNNRTGNSSSSNAGIEMGREHANNEFIRLHLARTETSGSGSGSERPPSSTSALSSSSASLSVSSSESDTSIAVAIGTCRTNSACRKNTAATQDTAPVLIPVTLPSTYAENKEWITCYMDLRNFQAKYGHARIPLTYPSNPTLSQWVAEQISQYKLFTKGKPTKMTDVHVELLEGVGLDLSDSEGCKWKQMFQEMQLFHSRFGHYEINPSVGMGSKELEQWVQKLLLQMRLLVEGKPSYLNDERVKMLEDIGFHWCRKVVVDPENDISQYKEKNLNSKKRNRNALTSLSSEQASSNDEVMFTSYDRFPTKSKSESHESVGSAREATRVSSELPIRAMNESNFKTTTVQNIDLDTKLPSKAPVDSSKCFVSTIESTNDGYGAVQNQSLAHTKNINNEVIRDILHRLQGQDIISQTMLASSKMHENRNAAHQLLEFLNAHNQGCSNAPSTNDSQQNQDQHSSENAIPSGINFSRSVEDNDKVNPMEILRNLRMMTTKTSTSDDDRSDHFAHSIGITNMTNLQYGHNHSSRHSNVESCLNTSNLVTFLKAQLISNQQNQASSNSCNKQGSDRSNEDLMAQLVHHHQCKMMTKNNC